MGKSIVRADGTDVGTLHNVTVNAESGVLRNLVVNPHGQFTARGYTETDEGRLLVPIERVKTVTDRIVIDN